ncbi:ubiquitin-activating enzyme E1-like [Monosporozyma unispora]|nr:E1 ubiquitin-activating protein uba2 [Kazachstania unispora]
MVREDNLIKIIGKDGYTKIRQTKCLLVGAGGIGSELLKDLILMEFGEIHIVDLDTIDLSNLNRQFLFRQRDIKQPKSTTAVKAVQNFNNSNLIPYQGNIMDTTQFPLHWFKQFNIIFNALDNLAARRYVNKMSQFLSLPLLESGTAGFDGYIQPIFPGKTECFDCTKKETPKTFPVCTIRSTPSQPIHCVVWAKNFLFNQLFADDDNQNEDNENKDWGTTDENEIKRIKQETNELQKLHNIILEQDFNRIPFILKKLFIDDISKLLLIENLWKTRTKPLLLDESIISENNHDVTEKKSLNEVWDIKYIIQRFIAVTKTLSQRMKSEGNFIEFDKDDEDTLEFVAMAANIRSYLFHIPMKSVFDIKQTAGNIIPAIATTNAIIAGLSALTSLRVLNLLDKYAPIEDVTKLNMAFTAMASNMTTNRYLSNPQLAPPNCTCPVCSQVVRGVVQLSDKLNEATTLEQLINKLKVKYGYGEDDDVSILDMKDQRLLYDFDFEDLCLRNLKDLKFVNGTIILFSDDSDNDEIKKPIELYFEIGDNVNELILPTLNIPMIKPKKPETDNEEKEEELVPMTENQEDEDGVVILDENDEEVIVEDSKKRPRAEDEDDLIEIIDLPKKAKN